MSKAFYKGYAFDKTKAKENENRSFVFDKLKDKDLIQRNKWKTSMCEAFITTGKCKFKDRCMFAHTKEELRKPVCLFGEFCKNKDVCDKDHTPNAVIPMIPQKPYHIPTAKKSAEQKIKDKEERKKAKPFRIELSDDEEDEDEISSTASSRCSSTTEFMTKPISDIMKPYESPCMTPSPMFMSYGMKEYGTYEGVCNDDSKEYLEHTLEKSMEINSEEDEELVNTMTNLTMLPKITTTKEEEIESRSNKEFIRDNFYEVKRLLEHVDAEIEKYGNIQLVDRDLSVPPNQFRKDFEEILREKMTTPKRKRLVIIELDEDEDFETIRSQILDINKKIKII
jgi:hypothetical protein